MTPRRRRVVVTVERTAKRWKALLLIGAGLTVLATIAIATRMHDLQPSVIEMRIAAFSFIAGILLILIALFGGWWNHG